MPLAGLSFWFDGVFFVDLPGRDQKDGIWSIYTRHYGLDAKQARPDDANWTGAEIKSCWKPKGSSR